jgi:hypothetical protein
MRLSPLVLTRFLHANRYPPTDQVQGHASLENVLEYAPHDRRCRMRGRQFLPSAGCAMREGAFVVAVAAFLLASPALAQPATVYFPSVDGKTQLVGYLFTPTTPGPHPAVVMLHAGPGLIRRTTTRSARWSPRARSPPAMPRRCRSGIDPGATTGRSMASSRCCRTVSGRAGKAAGSAASPM